MQPVCSSALLFPEFRSLGIVPVEWELAEWIPQVINHQDETCAIKGNSKIWLLVRIMELDVENQGGATCMMLTVGLAERSDRK